MYSEACGFPFMQLQASITKDDAARKSIVDPEIKNECSDESLKRMMELCVMCLSNQPTHRPSIEDILWNLQFATQVQNSTHNNNQELVKLPGTNVNSLPNYK